MQSSNRDIASVWDMVQAIRYIQTFTANLSFEAYLNDIRTISAVERQFEILGEAARRISGEFRQAHSAIDWQRIVGLRNIVIHRYDDVNQDVLWTIIQSELPPLQTQLESLLPPLPEEQK
ncbi:HepT-like ribonuclease domain-containing protein [Leptolyngbya ohadii]|uniref:HepT-like ribonuclease domain-containing protein n=1 Tax=Leptolyngbya ohadii TaxID=1962290 RepID=UPI000B5A14C3|nr:HepT-like ribonuclease domain-containing protein [Leptolyngbya ohadii]